MIAPAQYKDRPAVRVTAGGLSLLVLPRDGGKIASLTWRGRELLVTKPGDTYRVLTRDGSYVDSECSGFDDMFPTVDPDTPSAFWAEYPDHGECCRLPHRAELLEDRVILHADSLLFPIHYEKTVLPRTDGSILLRYRIENRSDREFPFLWAGHMMLRGEPGMQVLTPFPRDTKTEMMFVDPPVEPAPLPRDRLLAHEPGSGIAYKFYYSEPMPRGQFGVRYPDGSRLLFTVDPQKLPYLGIWLNNGTFQGGYSITPEPCSLPFDAPTRAATRGLVCQIPAGSVFSFDIQIQLKEESDCIP